MDLRATCKVIGDHRVRVDIPSAQSLVGSFEETEETLSREQAIEEAKRCTTSSPCVYCDVCQLICPDLAIVRDPGTQKVIIDLDYCKGCALCASYCPHGAIEMVLDE